MQFAQRSTPGLHKIFWKRCSHVDINADTANFNPINASYYECSQNKFRIEKKSIRNLIANLTHSMLYHINKSSHILVQWKFFGLAQQNNSSIVQHKEWGTWPWPLLLAWQIYIQGKFCSKSLQLPTNNKDGVWWMEIW
jgi:hypothetical protein